MKHRDVEADLRNQIVLALIAVVLFWGIIASAILYGRKKDCEARDGMYTRAGCLKKDAFINKKEAR